MRSLRSALIGLALVLVSFVALSGTATAQESGDTQGAYVGSETEVQAPPLSPAPAASSVAQPQAQAGSLAFTGTDVMVLSIMGGVTLIAGLAFMTARRRHATPA